MTSARVGLIVLICSLGVLLLIAQSPQAKEQIKERMENAQEDIVVLFDKDGNQMTQLAVSEELKRRYKSLEAFIRGQKATGSPVSGCDNPKATDPPPICVICSDGRSVCSKARFTGSR